MVPLDPRQMLAIAGGADLDGPLLGIAANDALAQTFGVEPGEQAEAAALQMADVAGMTGLYDGDTRQVVVIFVPTTDVTVVPEEAGNGAVSVDHLNRSTIQSFFTGPGDAGVAKQARGVSLDDAWALPAMQRLIFEQPLGWHDQAELTGIA